MAIEIPRWLIEFILLGPEDDRRQLQDSPILGDVWVEFAKDPGKPRQLLITPHMDHAAGTIAFELTKHDGIDDAEIAYLQGIVAARLSFEEVLRFVVPMSYWWNESRIVKAMKSYVGPLEKMEQDISEILHEAGKWRMNREPEKWRDRIDQGEAKSGTVMQDLASHKRYIALAGLILWANLQSKDSAGLETDQLNDVARAVAEAFKSIFDETYKDDTYKKSDRQSLVWTISLNRRASPALSKSVPAVKADAARTLFKVNCADIVWAVIDSGVDATHPAFFNKKGKQRVEKSFDFTRIREIVTLDNLRNVRRRTERVDKLLLRKLKAAPSRQDAEDALKILAENAKNGLSTDWKLVEALVEIQPDAEENRPPTNHGTHVAGIIGADGSCPEAGTGKAQEITDDDEDSDRADGMCPDIRIYDFRVLAPTLEETEFAIIAALQYIRYINERHNFITIHGANLSLSIPHDVRNYACGRTPICNECERLVNSGVVVVAAAGNRGYQNFETKDGLYESYAAFSVTDPGNADGVITVGATHRFWPHTYGVSFFSSRGPTGDGRLKPDLVAPGERIRAPLPNKEWGDLDGTSMAAPHVSGAAAMLMARYSELIGQPRRIKKILCDSATDLGRERSFQGHGMLDVLRAFQSI